MKRTHYKVGSLLAIMLILATLASCGEKQCNHNYRLTDHTAATATRNGQNVYTCSECHNSYSEVIPATGVSASKGEDESTTSNNGGFGSNSRTVRLFDLPVYSDDGNNAVSTLTYYSEAVKDSLGYKHEDCYGVCTSTTRSRYIRYDLNGKYATLSGTIYSRDGGVAWLEFYDGEEFLFSTNRLSESNPVVEFEFDIAGVEYLTVYPCRESYDKGSWVITEITVTK